MTYNNQTGELQFYVYLDNKAYDEVSCSFNFLSKIYKFTYSPEDKKIYSHTELNLDAELSKLILSICNQTIEEVNELDDNAHQLMETILKVKGYEHVVWK